MFLPSSKTQEGQDEAVLNVTNTLASFWEPTAYPESLVPGVEIKSNNISAVHAS